MGETVNRPSDAGFFGTFYAKAIAGCPKCSRELVEPTGQLPTFDSGSVVVVCPGCESVLLWYPEKPEDRDADLAPPTTITAVRDLLIEANSVLNHYGVPGGDDVGRTGDYLSPLCHRIAWLAEHGKRQ